MAFKMNPKSPALKSTGMYSSPVKHVPGPGPISSPAKQVDKMGQRIIKQGVKAEAAKAEGNDKKATRHTNRAGRMNERDMKKKTKQNLNNSPAKQNASKYKLIQSEGKKGDDDNKLKKGNKSKKGDFDGGVRGVIGREQKKVADYMESRNKPKKTTPPVDPPVNTVVTTGGDKKKKKAYVKKGGKATGNMKDYALNSQARADEYTARGWKQDATSKVKKPKVTTSTGTNTNTGTTTEKKTAGSLVTPDSIKIKKSNIISNKFDGGDTSSITNNKTKTKPKGRSGRISNVQDKLKGLDPNSRRAKKLNKRLVGMSGREDRSNIRKAGKGTVTENAMKDGKVDHTRQVDISKKQAIKNSRNKQSAAIDVIKLGKNK